MAAAHAKGRQRRGRNDKDTMTVWDLGNKMLNSTAGKNLMATLPHDINTEAQASDYVGLCALLELKSPLASKGGKRPKAYYNKS